MKTYYHDQTEKVGECLVDSGTVMIGDPCYVLPRKVYDDPGVDYEELLKEWEKSDYKENSISLHGVNVFSTPWGDGSYPIYAVIKGSKIMRLIVDFEEEEDYEY